MIDELKPNEELLIRGLEIRESDQLAKVILHELLKMGMFGFYNEFYTVDEMLFDRTIQKVKNTLYKEKKAFSAKKYKEVVRSCGRIHGVEDEKRDC